MSMPAAGAKTDLANLADMIRRILPARPPISNLEVREDLGHVSFHWQAKDFAVDKRLNVFELKGKTLFVTASSILLQSVLHKKDKNRRVIEAVIEVLSEVQHLINTKHRVENGIQLLRSAQGTLAKLIVSRKPERTTANSTPEPRPSSLSGPSAALPGPA